jgi:hypothetical protein
MCHASEERRGTPRTCARPELTVIMRKRTVLRLGHGLGPLTLAVGRKGGKRRIGIL